MTDDEIAEMVLAVVREVARMLEPSRPEVKLEPTGVFVHPSDARYVERRAA